jgi:hypothetical protein
MKRILTTLPVLAALLVAACASGPGITSRRVPDWVLEPPADSDQFEYFVVSASSPDGDVSAAEEAAGYALLTEVNQALGVEITVETSAEARSTLDSFEADLVQQVTQRGSGQVEGLRIADRYVAEQGTGVAVYLLGEYERGAFLAERAKRQALLREQEELLTGPESGGDRLVAEGRLTQAILQYGQAVAAASASDLRTADVVLRRTLRKATDTASRLSLEVAGGPTTVAVGERPAEPVIFRLSDDRGRPVPGAVLEISYLTRRGTRDTVRTETRTTAADGTVVFAHPAPTAVGEYMVTARLEADALFTLVAGAPEAVRTEVAALENAVVGVRAVYRFVSLSRAREIPTGVLVADLDAAGAVMPASETAGGILESLAQSGFLVRTMPVDSADALMNTSELTDLLRASAPAGVRRVIVGSASIAEFRDDDGVLVKVTGSVQALDLQTGLVLYSASGVKNARSRSVERAISTAFRELGRQLAEELAANLP